MKRALRLLAVALALVAGPAAAQSVDTAPRREARVPARPRRQQPRPRTPAHRPPVAKASVDTARPASSPDTTASGDAQRLPYRTGVAPAAVTVGDVFRSAVFLALPAGAKVEMLIPGDSAADVQAVEAPRVYPPGASGGDSRVVASLVAWRPGIADSLAARLRVTLADGTARSIPIQLRIPQIRSVLPPDTTQWKPRPPHDVWGPGEDWRVIAALAALALLLLAALAWLVRRLMRRRPKRRLSPQSARQWALGILDQARNSGLAEAGSWKAFYSLVSQALRGYAAALDLRWSEDLTTSELLERMRADVADERLAPLAHALRVADLAKFARRGRTVPDALADLATARQWVETFGAADPYASAASADAPKATAGAAP